MQLIYPWALLSLVPVAAAAFWALRRPMHKVMPIGSLRLWERAIESLGPAAKKTRRLSVAWLMLLAGAAAAGIALSRPVYYAESPARRIAVAVWPSAELAGLEHDTLEKITRSFLQKLSDADHVRLVLPTVLGGSSDFITPDEAVRRISEIYPLPVAAEDLTLPVMGEDVQHTYRFAPATLKLEDGPDTTTIALPAKPGDVTIDAFAVETVSLMSSSPEPSVQIFVAVRNHTTEPKRGEVGIAGKADNSWGMSVKYDLPPGGRQSLIIQPPADGYYVVRLTGLSGPGASAFAVRRRSTTADVAMIGRSDPLVRRFVQKNPALRLIADPAKADAVIAIGKEPPPGVPAVVIDPPKPPSGFGAGVALENFALRVRSDHPIFAHVDLSGVAVRRAIGWIPISSTPPSETLLSVGGGTLVLVRDRPRRVWLAFDTAVENTNFAMTESFVIFLSNVFKYLAPQARPRISYEFISPLQAGPETGWKPVGLLGKTQPVSDKDGPLPQPGLYRDKGGDLHAVSLTSLKSATPKTDPLKRIAEISLPEPQPLTQGRELWPFLALLAGLLWLGGWVVRMR